jgi:hypothetical protein
MAARLRSCALLAAGALALHQLRYMLAYGHDAGAALREQGHAYLAPVTGVVVTLVVIALASALRRIAAGAPAAGGRRLLRLWPGAVAALLTVFAVQESLEGALTPGHPGGVAALAGHGGWVAVPLAVAIGLVVALMTRGVAPVTYAVARRFARAAVPRAPLVLLARPAPPPRRFPALATAAGRAPPRAS